MKPIPIRLHLIASSLFSALIAGQFSALVLAHWQLHEYGASLTCWILVGLLFLSEVNFARMNRTLDKIAKEANRV